MTNIRRRQAEDGVWDVPPSRWPLPVAVRRGIEIPWRAGREACRSFMTPELPYRAGLHAKNRRWVRR